jgi:hypothetical protein
MNYSKIYLKMKLILIVFFVFCLLILNSYVEKLNAMGKKIPIKEVETKKEITIKDGEQWYKYEPEIVALKGTIITLSAFGPPNYGENPDRDEKVIYYALELDNPINVKGNLNSELNTDTFKNISTIQILLSESDRDIKDKINKKVIITGTLFQRITGHHFTKVLIDAQKIDLIDVKKK